MGKKIKKEPNEQKCNLSNNLLESPTLKCNKKHRKPKHRRGHTKNGQTLFDNKLSPTKNVNKKSNLDELVPQNLVNLKNSVVKKKKQKTCLKSKKDDKKKNIVKSYVNINDSKSKVKVNNAAIQNKNEIINSEIYKPHRDKVVSHKFFQEEAHDDTSLNCGTYIDQDIMKIENHVETNCKLLKKNSKHIFKDSETKVQNENVMHVINSDNNNFSKQRQKKPNVHNEKVLKESESYGIPKNKNKEVSNEDSTMDEEIDEFCNELNDSDNEQYESWVKLIEAKLHSKKN